MLQDLLMRRASSVIGAIVGGYGVFCVIYSFSSPEMAVQALILLGAALVLSQLAARQ